jgi:hypothetical protein
VNRPERSSASSETILGIWKSIREERVAMGSFRAVLGDDRAKQGGNDSPYFE